MTGVRVASQQTKWNSPKEMVVVDKKAENDGGPVPTAEQQERIRKIRSNITLSHQYRGLLRDNRFLRWFRKTFSFFYGDSNKLIYGVLKLLREKTKVQDADLAEVDFSNNVEDTLYYQTKKRFPQNLQVDLLYFALRFAPPIVEDKTFMMSPTDYKALVDDKIYPTVMMQCQDPLECFLKNAPIFCNVNGICDLQYLSQYQVKKGHCRYGGIAMVKNGQIKTIDGLPDHYSLEQKQSIFLSSFAVHVIVMCHATLAHLAVYQRLLINVTTRRGPHYIDYFSNKKEGPKRFLQGLVTRANEVSINQQLLTGPGNSLVGRATSFTNNSLMLALSDRYNLYSKMATTSGAEALIQHVGSCGGKTWKRACTRAYQSSKKAVQIICREGIQSGIIDNDTLEDLALMVWSGTFYHGVVGDFQIDNVIKGNLPLLNTGKPHLQTKSYGILSATIGVATMTRTCDMETLASYFPEEQHKKAWNDHLKVIQSLKIGIPEYDKNMGTNTEIYNAVNF